MSRVGSLYGLLDRYPKTNELLELIVLESLDPATVSGRLAGWPIQKLKCDVQGKKDSCLGHPR